MAALALEEVTFAKLADIIEKDTALSGNVLRLVNSALYGRRGEINSVRHAVSLLGIAKLRNATLGMSISRMWGQVKTPPKWSMARFNLHSVATAMLADTLAQKLPISYGEGAFVAGLFHDLGRLLIAISLPAEWEKVDSLYTSGAGDIIACERQVLGFTHAELAAEALVTWNLPDHIRSAVLYHHHPEEDQSAVKEGEIRLSLALAGADEYVNQSGNSLSPQAEKLQPIPGRLMECGLGEELPRVLADFEAEFNVMKSFF